MMVTRNVAEAVDPPKVKEKQVKAWNQGQVQQFLPTSFRAEGRGRQGN